MLLVLLLLFGVQAALPHVHERSSHDSEICAGHLAEHGVADEAHATSCKLCRMSSRSRMFVASGGYEDPAPQELVRARTPALLRVRLAPICSHLGARAPPAFA